VGNNGCAAAKLTPKNGKPRVLLAFPDEEPLLRVDTGRSQVHGTRQAIHHLTVKPLTFSKFAAEVFRLRTTLLFVLAVPVFGATRSATLEAIHHLENPRDSRRPGARGELGAYQFRRQTWRMHTNEPFSRALERRVSDDVAQKHYEWLKAGLERGGLPASSYNIALAWNCGLGAVLNGRTPAASRDYAERAVALATEFDGTKSLAAVAQR